MAKKKPVPARQKGRPSDYTDQLASRICDELALGRSLKTVCENEWAPAMATVFRWMDRPDFRERYARAKEESADVLAEQILDLADAKDSDVQRSRLQVDARKWIAAKLKPKKYGDKITNELTGPDGGPVQFRNLTAEQLNKELVEAFKALPPEMQETLKAGLTD